MKYKDDWIITDPDNFQYGKRINPYIFEFKEFNRIDNDDLEHVSDKRLFIESIWDNDEYWVKETIDLKTYSIDQIINCIEGYYINLDALFDIYGVNSCSIIAKCIFKQTNGLY